jgi:hypothetical protein
MSTLAVKLDATATDVQVTDASLHIVLADGRELTAPLACSRGCWRQRPSNVGIGGSLDRARASIGRTSMRIFRS